MLKLEMKGHEESVSAIAALPDGSGYVSGSMDYKIIFWVAKLLFFSFFSDLTKSNLTHTLYPVLLFSPFF
jgi:hypothetical protein